MVPRNLVRMKSISPIRMFDENGNLLGVISPIGLIWEEGGKKYRIKEKKPVRCPHCGKEINR